MRITPPRRRGFTFIECVVVAAIALLVTAVTLPAVQQARSQARFANCKDRLKMLGLAMHNYHDTFNSFPAAWYARDPRVDDRRWMGWQTSLLPFMEHAAAFQQIYDSRSDSGRNVPEWPKDDKVAQLAIPEYRCSNDTTGETNAVRGGFGTSNYSGNFGPEPLSQWADGRTQQFWPGTVERWPMTRRLQIRGVFDINSNVGFRDIVDGSSNTLMLGERSAASGAGIWIGVQSAGFPNDVITDGSHLSGINRSFAGYSSRHAGGIHIALCDGSVRFVSDELDSNPNGTGILQLLAGINDGQPVGEF